MIKVSDYIFRHLVGSHGIEHCFLVTGGGAMHLNDSIGHTLGLTYLCNHHEQASAIAAEGYYRACGNLCVTNVTTAPAVRMPLRACSVSISILYPRSISRVR